MTFSRQKPHSTTALFTIGMKPYTVAENATNPKNKSLSGHPRADHITYLIGKLSLMEHANYSKPTETEINRAETDLLLTVSQVTGRKFAELAGWHESKISRTNWRDIATIFCIARMAAECSPLGRAVQEVFKAVGNKKPLAATKGSSQITMSF